MSLFLGIDGGGSNLRLCVMDETGKTHKRETLYQTVNPESAGMKNVRETVFKLSRELGAASNLIEGIMVSMAGLGNQEHLSAMEGFFQQAFPSASNVIIKSDAEGSLMANFQEAEGMVVIAGTGSVILGRDRSGNLKRSGGWGYLLGDEGSGFWLVKQVFVHYLHYIDGLGEKNKAFEVFEERLSENARYAAAFFYQPAYRKEIAALSTPLMAIDNPLVWGIAQAGIMEIAKRVKILKSELTEHRLELAYMGGLFKNSRYLATFKRCLSSADIEIIKGIEVPETAYANIARRKTKNEGDRK